jgi:hypothetical protein
VISRWPYWSSAADLAARWQLRSRRASSERSTTRRRSSGLELSPLEFRAWRGGDSVVAEAVAERLPTDVIAGRRTRWSGPSGAITLARVPQAWARRRLLAVERRSRSSSSAGASTAPCHTLAFTRGGSASNRPAADRPRWPDPLPAWPAPAAQGGSRRNLWVTPDPRADCAAPAPARGRGSPPVIRLSAPFRGWPGATRPCGARPRSGSQARRRSR